MRMKHRGFVLMELVIALAILAALSIGLISVIRSQAQSKQLAIAANQLVDFTNATEQYVKNEYNTILSSAGSTNPVVINVANLQAAGLLPASYPSANVFGQVPTGRSRKASANTLETLVIYSGGVALSQSDLDELAGLAAQQGVAGGSVGSVDTTRAVGFLGAWSMPLSNFAISPGAGRAAANVSYTNEARSDTALHRQAIPGRPELNRMSTSIDMANNNIDNGARIGAQNVDAANGIQANQIAIGKAPFGAVPYPYETIQLNNGYNLRMAIGGREHTVLQSDGNLITHGTVAADGDVQAGNARFAGNVTANANIFGNDVYANGWFRSRGNGGWYSEQYGGGWHMTDTTWIRAYGDKNIYTGGEIRGGAVTAEGRLQANELKLNRIESEGASCSETGLNARSSQGALLSCTLGQWRSGGGISTTIVTGARSAGCSLSSYATCPVGTLVVSGGYMWNQNCNGKEEYQFTSFDRPWGNAGWEARVQQALVTAYAICVPY
ncbi:shufflon system plasmid conjugative transfer pilus tip adhesin PilV [Xanthomonas campestris]|uniref:shufflon system plasmid conjugative transfer pilus tip adhesin PilV n=1 Tax=Xanthomonas campestris TaxID=339 RepID=UPI0020C993D4|nr:shufflon system plasmid conjugative transfer pilus tip adhesin PilV [Xanthomonas campestris]MDM7717834.1 shufflon system plasmid conjugative transfer pilus tip adhesin PilV [Xanthomonas campestris pv. campestris]MEA0952183.1 shufflon system plasmid conjugative transfer pilus tip adhesin PilV [Xanthomonas campestris pv. campestris]MEB1105839.1 shufflon system plasmid conjugative transfer pilus tip adhesin PilV [Xanthomonas campestris pv. campestris]MEB1624287.1 shufflon system plasmid conjuga